MQNIYADPGQQAVDQLDVNTRANFIVRTYTHLLGAIAAFTAIEIALFSSGIAESIAAAASGRWLLFMGAFLVVGWLATSVAHRATSAVAQYGALAGFVAMEAVVFAPMLYIAAHYAPPGIIQSAAAITLVGFGLLTFIAFWTRKDFSFMGATLRFVGIGAVVAIVAGAIMGFQLGMWFSVGMILFAGAAVLYDTSNVLHHYPEDRHVAASLQLFASVAMMFWYVLRLLMSLSRD